jgi:hypothetical protein
MKLKDCFLKLAAKVLRITVRSSFSKRKKGRLWAAFGANIKLSLKREEKCARVVSRNPINPEPCWTITIGYQVIIAVVPEGDGGGFRSSRDLVNNDPGTGIKIANLFVNH